MLHNCGPFLGHNFLDIRNIDLKKDVNRNRNARMACPVIDAKRFMAGIAGDKKSPASPGFFYIAMGSIKS